MAFIPTLKTTVPYTQSNFQSLYLYFNSSFPHTVARRTDFGHYARTDTWTCSLGIGFVPATAHCTNFQRSTMLRNVLGGSGWLFSKVAPVFNRL